MKKLFTLFALLAMFSCVGCEPLGSDNITPDGNQTEQPNDEPDDGNTEKPDEGGENPDLITPPTNQIWYTSTDGKIVTPNYADVFGANIVSNTYEDSKGIITFDGDVTEVGPLAFQECHNLSTITLPNSVITILQNAFNTCSNLASIDIPNSVTSIGSWVFYNCSNLTSVTIPDSVIEIGPAAFWGCSSLVSINISSSVTTIGGEAFFHCPNLESIVVDANNPIYDSRDNCNAIIETATNTLFVGCKNTAIPNSVTSLVDSFATCSSLTNVVIPASVTLIAGAFKDCTNLESIVVDTSNPIYDSRDNSNAIIESATNTLVVGCKNSIIPNGITSIGIGAFQGCGITNISIPDSVTSIGEGAFHGCLGLTSITIPDSVISIGGNTFYGCSNLSSVTLGNNLSSIEPNLFMFCSSLSSVNIPESVTSIGNTAFWHCKNLKSISIPNGVTSIGRSAFADTGLFELTIPASVRQIGQYLVNEDCPNLESLHFLGATPPSFISGNGRTVAGNLNNPLFAIYVPNLRATYDYRNAFSDKDIYPKGAILNKIHYTSNTGEIIEDPEIGYPILSNKYYGNGGVITVGHIIRDIPKQAFFATTLTSIVIPDSVEKIDHEAFGQCMWLSEIECRPITPPTIDGLNTFTITSSLEIYVDDDVYDDYASADLWGTVWGAFLRSTYLY